MLHSCRTLPRVAPTFVLKYNIRAVRALGSAGSDLAGLDEVVEGGAGDVQYLGDRGLGDILAQQRPDVLLLAVEPGCSQGPLGPRPSSFPLALAAASPSLVRSEIRSRSTSANNPNSAIITLVRRSCLPSNSIASLMAMKRILRRTRVSTI